MKRGSLPSLKDYLEEHWAKIASVTAATAWSSRGTHSISARDIFPQICPLRLLLRVRKLPHHSQPSKLRYHLWFYPFLSINIRPAMNQLLPCFRSHVLSYHSSFCIVTEVRGFIQLLPGYLTTLGAATDPSWDPFFTSPVASPPPSPPHPSLSFAPDLCTLPSLLGIPFTWLTLAF